MPLSSQPGTRLRCVSECHDRTRVHPVTSVVQDIRPKQPVSLMGDRQVAPGQATHRRRPLLAGLLSVGAFSGVEAHQVVHAVTRTARNTCC